MRILDLTLPTPAENLALEEALLQWAEETESECLRLWESAQYFVVLGAGSPVRTDVNVDVCRAAGVPILRRCSGGGTVLQGPGCLNYTLVLDRQARPELETINGTNQYILSRISQAIQATDEIGSTGDSPGVGSPEIQGISDLTLNDLKFSGNAQRRRKRFILFHGTILHDFDLPTIFRLLGKPEKMPDYREGRDHLEFIANLPLSGVALKHSIARQWQAEEVLIDWPAEQTRILASTRYADQDWIFGM